MGIWQFFQAANILHTPIISHYPEKSNPTVRKDLGRKLYPSPHQAHQPEYHILWTYFGRISRPCHFVPLLAVQITDDTVPQVSFIKIRRNKYKRGYQDNGKGRGWGRVRILLPFWLPLFTCSRQQKGGFVFHCSEIQLYHSTPVWGSN